MNKNNLKLSQLAKKELMKKEMREIKGGDVVCGCGCCYANQGGASTLENGAANAQGGLHSPGCDNQFFFSDVIVTP